MAEKKKEEHGKKLAEWKERVDTGQEDPRELFKQVSHIAIYMSYDLIDKLRWWETDTLKRSNEEIEKRIPHMSTFLDRLQRAYLEFSDVDL